MVEEVLNKELNSKILTFTSSMTRYNSVGMSISSIRSTILGCLTRLRIDTSFCIMCSCHTKEIFNDYGLVGKTFTSMYIFQLQRELRPTWIIQGFNKKVIAVASGNIEETRLETTSV